VFPQDVTTPWNLCTYVDNTTGAALLTQPAIYNVAPVLGVNSAVFSSTSGPAQGNSVVTITGLTGIPTAEGALLTARLGNAPLTITNRTTTSITGTTSASAAGPVKLTVTTAAGTRTTTTNVYTYTYGITVTPNSAPTRTVPVLDIMGAGFGALTFGNVTNNVALTDDTAYVFLTDNTWNAQTFNGIDATVVDPISYCNDVLPISDNEIICSLNLDERIASVSGTGSAQVPTITAGANVSAGDVPAGTYTVTVVNANAALNAATHNYSVVSSGSTFTVAPF
jgi:hypothetical protein